MNKIAEFNVRHKIISEGEGRSFQFFCDLSDEPVYTTMPIFSINDEEALMIAKKEARQYFNCCRSCGRWVTDEFYDIDELLCSECLEKSGKTEK